MEDSLGSSHLEGELLVAEAYSGGGLAYGSDTGSGMTLGEVTDMIGMITARPEESGSDYATGHELTVGSPLDLAVGLRQGQPAYPVEEDTNMESAPWGYRSFERIRMANQFGEAAERILIHEWTPETHDLATLPAQVEQLTGALNYLQTFNFEAVSAISEIRQVIQALSRELELHARGVQVDGSALTARVEALGQLLNEVNNEVQDQRSRLDSKRAEMQSTLEQATAAALEYRQVAEALKAKVDNSRQGWEQATNELKRQLEGVLNEVTGLISHRAQLDKSFEELKSLEGKVLNCDRVTTNVAEEIRRIGLNFGDAENRVHGVEAMVESRTMPKPELAKVEALELQVPLLITRLEQSEHEVQPLREEIRTRPHGGPPEGMRPDSHVIGELQRKLESLENKYQLSKHAGTPSVNPIGIPTPTPKPEPRVRVFGVPAREERVAGSLPGFGFPPAEDDLSSMRSDDRGFRGRAPRGARSGTRTHEGHTPPGMGGDWRHCAGLGLRYFEADGDGWFMPRMVFQLFNRQESLKDGIGLPKQKPSGILRAMAFDEVCPERLLDAPFDWEEPELEGTDPRLIPPGVHGRLATPVMDPRTLGDVEGMSVAPRWDESGTTAIKWFLDFRAWERNWMYGLTDAMRRAVLLSLIPASRSNPLKEMVNRYQFRYQDLLREVTEEVFTEANDDVIMEAFHTVKPSSLTPAPREFINFVEQFLALGRRVRDGITQRQAKDRLLDVIATMKVDGLLKEIIKEETKVGLEFNYLETIVYVMNPLMSRHKLAIKKGHIMRRLGQAIPEAPQPKPQVPPQRMGNKYGSGRVRGMEGVEDMDKAEDPEGHQDQEQADPELSIPEIQEICEAQVLAMSGRAGAGASSIPKCPACGKGRHSREDCWVLHPHKAPEWLQDKLKSKKIGKGGQAKPAAQGGGKGKGPHKGGKFPPCKGCGSTLHPPEDCWRLHPELREKAKAEGRLGKRHN